MDKIVMGYWDCPVCGTKEIRGDITGCPSCGRARGDVQFYLKGYQEGAHLSAEEANALGAEEIDSAQAAEMNQNPDWYCSFCNSLNSDSSQVCTTCGASRADSESNYFDELKKRKEKEAAELAAQPRPAAPKKKRPAWLIPAVLAAVGLLVFLLWPKTIKGQITGISWTRNIEIQEYQSFSESDWTLPEGAESVETRQELRTRYRTDYVPTEVQKSRTVQTGTRTEYSYEDLGNGKFRKVSHEIPVYDTEYYTETVMMPVSVPYTVYETKYYYTVWRWVHSRDVPASGEDHDPYWPEVTLGENEREGGRTGEYRFTAADEKGTSATYRLVRSDHAESDWMKLSVGDKVQIKGKRTVTDMDGNKLADIEEVR